MINLDADQIHLLEASGIVWRDVEPLTAHLERALDPRERHKWRTLHTARLVALRCTSTNACAPSGWRAVLRHSNGQTKPKPSRSGSLFAPTCQLAHTRPCLRHRQLPLRDARTAQTPRSSCTLRDLGQGQQSLELAGVMVTPANLLGIELNPRAAAIAELVLWIGFLQWHLRTHGGLQGLPEPIIRDLHNVENRDAVLAWDCVA